MGNQLVRPDQRQAQQTGISGNFNVGGDVTINQTQNDNPTIIHNHYEAETRFQETREAISFQVPEAPPNFFGRESYLEEIYEAFAGEGDVENQLERNSARAKSVILHGMPGVGKSSIAAAFISRNRSRWRSFNVIWLSAGSKEDIREQFVQLGEKRLKLVLRDEKGLLEKDKFIMDIIYNELTKNPSLIVFDNAACGNKSMGMSENIADFLCGFVQVGKHYPLYLITSRTQGQESWRACQGHLISLSPFDEEESWNYMREELPILAKYEGDCRRLGTFFEHLPIAIEHAVNVMTYEWELCSCGATYNPRKFILMALELKSRADEILLDTYEKLNRLWDYSLELIQKVPRFGKEALEILNYLSLLSPSGVPEDFLLSVMKSELKSNSEAGNSGREYLERRGETQLGLLRKLSLVKRTEKVIHVHVLLQEHRRRELEYKGQLKGIVIGIANAIIGEPDLVSYKSESYAYNFQNAEHVCGAIVKYIGKEDCDELKLKFAEMFGSIMPEATLNLVSSFPEVKRLPLRPSDKSAGESDRPVGKILIGGKDLRKTCRICSLLADYYIQTGWPDVSRQILTILHDTLRKIHGEAEPGILALKTRLAKAYLDLGKYDEAFKLYTEIYGCADRTLGPGDLITVTAKGNVATCLWKLGNFRQALKLYEEMEKARGCSTLGTELSDGFILQNNLASCHAELDDYEKALELCKKMYEERCGTHGEDHPDTLWAKFNVASRLQNQGKLEPALKMFREILDVRVRTLGEEHPHSLGTLNNVGVCFLELGRVMEARDAYRKVYDAQVRILGPEHPDTLLTKSNMANCYAKMERKEEALKMSREVHKVRCRVLGKNHPLTLGSLHDVANRYAELGHHTKALKMHQDLHKIRSEILGKEHPTTLLSVNNISNCYAEMNQHEKALELLKQVYKIQSRNFGEDDLGTLRTKANMAGRYLSLKEYGPATEISRMTYAALCRLGFGGYPEAAFVKRILNQCAYRIQEEAKEEY